jgi:zinc transporter 9
MAASTSVKAVISALVGNSFVTVIKLIAFMLSGSGAMLSEAIHSFADTGNQLLLFIGLKRGQREADDRFHYGYGGERFVFGMLSAAGIFFIGFGITVYHGISSLIDPHTPHLTATTFIVLGVAFVIEGSVLLYAARTVDRERGSVPFFQYVREHADPATVAILLEDGAAVLGLVLAAGGILLAYATGNPVWDSIGSIVVGLVLGGVAYYLVRENRELLLGRAVPEGIEARFTEIVLRQPSVRSIRDVKTRQLTPEAFKFKAEITLDNDYLATSIGRELPVEHHALDGSQREPMLRRIAAIATDQIATEIEAIEAAVRAEIPQARHIDLEVAHPREVPTAEAANTEDAPARAP